MRRRALKSCLQPLRRVGSGNGGLQMQSVNGDAGSGVGPAGTGKPKLVPWAGNGKRARYRQQLSGSEHMCVLQLAHSSVQGLVERMGAVTEIPSVKTELSEDGGP